MGGFSIAGLGGGLDVQGIVQQILFAERQPVRNLEAEKQRLETKIKAYNDLNSQLSSLLSKLDALKTDANFSVKLTSSSDESVLTATATSEAAPGSYQIQVNRLVLFDNFASDATFATANEVIGTGSFDLTVGTSSTTITIDSSNNTLEGLKNAINNSAAAARAEIIFDGSGYRLTITSDDSGSSNAISIDNNTLTLADSNPFTFTRSHTIATINDLDASLTINGLAVTSSSNDVDGLVEGVTLNLRGTSASTVSLGVSDDVDQIKEKIQEFVDEYNSVYSFLNSQFSYSEALEDSGILSGETVVRNVQYRLSRMLSQAVTGLSGSYNNLASAGIELQSDGTLEINDTKLDQALAENLDDVRKLFTSAGEATHSAVQFLNLSSATQPGTYQVDITQLPESAQVVSPNAITSMDENETLTFSLGSGTSIVNLTVGMDIDQVVSTVNAQFVTDGIALTASKNGSNQLVITSQQQGASVSFSVVSDSTIPSTGTGFDTTGSSDAGQDVAGTFTDTATTMTYSGNGAGSVLIGDEGPSEGLQIQFSGTTTGTFGTVTPSLGVAAQMSQYLDSVTDSLEGPIDGALDTLNASIRLIDQEIADFEDRLVLRQRFLVDQFSRANEALQQLSFLQSSLGTQLNQLNSLF